MSSVSIERWGGWVSRLLGRGLDIFAFAASLVTRRTTASRLGGLSCFAASFLGLVLFGGCTSAEDGGRGEVAVLRQTVVAQQARVAAIEAEMATIRRGAAVPRPAGSATASPPTATPVPPVTGMPMAGNTKGNPDARVTMTEYFDFQ